MIEIRKGGYSYLANLAEYAHPIFQGNISSSGHSIHLWLLAKHTRKLNHYLPYRDIPLTKHTLNLVDPFFTTIRSIKKPLTWLHLADIRTPRPMVVGMKTKCIRDTKTVRLPGEKRIQIQNRIVWIHIIFHGYRYKYGITIFYRFGYPVNSNIQISTETTYSICF